LSHERVFGAKGGREAMMRQLAMADAEPAAEVLARAFYNDPLWLYLLPEPTQRAAMVRHTFRAVLPVFVGSGRTYGVGAPLAGVAAWELPGRNVTQLSGLLNPALFTLLFAPLLRVFRRALPIFARFEEMHRQYAPQPHYYLNTIGVVPETQGKGLASQLIKPFLAQADARAASAYTETMTPENVPLYEHYGFVCREAYRVPGTDLFIWALYRPAKV
jgi:GNAT superfamily N-acetyltransferase